PAPGGTRGGRPGRSPPAPTLPGEWAEEPRGCRLGRALHPAGREGRPALGNRAPGHGPNLRRPGAATAPGGGAKGVQGRRQPAQRPSLRTIALERGLPAAVGRLGEALAELRRDTSGRDRFVFVFAFTGVGSGERI